MNKLLPILFMLLLCGCKKENHTDTNSTPETLLTEPSQFQKSYIATISPSYSRNSEGDIMVLGNGKYLAAYTRFNQSGTDASSSQIVGRISSDTTGKNWDADFVISSNIAKKNVLSVSLLRINTSTIQCYFLVNNGLNDVKYYRSISVDDGKTWASATAIINEGVYLGILNGVVHRTNNNRVIIPATFTLDASKPSAIFGCFIYYSDNDAVSFKKSNIIIPGIANGGFETSVIQLSGNNLLMRIRTSGAGFQYFSNSSDNGTTWGTPYVSTLSSTNSPAQIVNIGGKLVAFHNPNINTATPRNPLRISKSLDNGVSWTKVADLENTDPSTNNYSYSSVTVNNGYLLVSYWETVGTTGINLKFSKIKISALGL